jgi:hypothetical protein
MCQTFGGVAWILPRRGSPREVPKHPSQRELRPFRTARLWVEPGMHGVSPRHLGNGDDFRKYCLKRMALRKSGADCEDTGSELTRLLHVRSEERLGQRTRIAQDCYDTLLQGILSGSKQLYLADDNLYEESPAKPPSAGYWP